jgi:hypothetical protein
LGCQKLGFIVYLINKDLLEVFKLTNDFEIEDLFDVVVEPKHSKSELLKLQKRYNMSTEDFLQLPDSELSFTIPQKEIEYWFFQYEMYVEAEGNPRELSLEHFSSIMYDDLTFDDDPILSKIQLDISQIEKEAEKASFSI